MSTAILFTHGIQGSPAQFIFLTERLPVPQPTCGHNWFSAEGKERIADTLNATPKTI